MTPRSAGVGVFNNRAVRADGNAQPAVIAAVDIQVGRLTRIQAHNGPHLAHLRRQAAAAGSTELVINAEADKA